MNPATQPPLTGPDLPTSIKLVSHSMLFYWWPVWLVGFVLGNLSLVERHALAIVPEGTRLQTGSGSASEKTATLVLPAGGTAGEISGHPAGEGFTIAVSPNRHFGLAFCCVLLVVVFS